MDQEVAVARAAVPETGGAYGPRAPAISQAGIWRRRAAAALAIGFRAGLPIATGALAPWLHDRGTTDIISRLVTQPLTERLGQPFVIEPRPGAGTNLATETVVRAAPDGYTLLFVGAPNAINASLYSKLSFNFIRDIAPVAAIASVPMVLIVHPSVPVTTVPELLAYIKANPGKINMATPGIGTTPHLAGELFKMMSVVDVQHVPYRGAAPAMTDLLAGHVQLYFSTAPVSIEHIRSGRVRGLAVTTAERLGGASGPADHRRVRAEFRGHGLVASVRHGRHPHRSSTSSTARSTRSWPSPR
jgi:tripartite-type tricarboxylate transporter receptor subunit TctC